jgi:hypothetical protein
MGAGDCFKATRRTEDENMPRMQNVRTVRVRRWDGREGCWIEMPIP